jgi:hypothetical protein
MSTLQELIEKEAEKKLDGDLERLYVLFHQNSKNIFANLSENRELSECFQCIGLAAEGTPNLYQATFSSEGLFFRKIKSEMLPKYILQENKLTMEKINKNS